MWEDPHTFEKDMKDAHYHNNVRAYLNNSFTRKDINLNSAREVEDLGKHLGIEAPEFFSWKMKHGNHGLLLFERKKDESCEWRKNLLRNVAGLLSFCGI